ncbi:DUF397 domain-containing protein [Streptomyces sp. NBC_00257]|uniref:DUF397 domain-containing protein n=1 Tax=unclassified Streptomyces TaxID=2593676 RepID=UPI00224E14B5|nr:MULTISPECIES: DUF397 domain-containing protein [unclassified Streptomyces]MCX4866469.1 DUF397 domain-containing protein [Streptomyces sp. NBC_00906]MCX4897707.1 DUF397 domain-containing protein [Streptomyces sp. NBC_00892]MCX5431005.1 DUF397 domain-containing protein [Streptomyces sp. NBC_00062]
MSIGQLNWFKSSYSSGGGGNCIEVAYDWRKSSYSSGGGGECVEVATCPAAVHVRDSKNVQGPRLDVAPGAWAAFVSYAQQG